MHHLRRLSYWLDEGIRIPGTRIRIGLDPILGLVPGVGDAAGAILAAGILMEGVRRGVSRFTFVRMAGNTALDALLGAFPLIGDVFDAAWKANLRNLVLLERHLAEPSASKRVDRLFVLAVGGALFLLGASLVVGGAWLAVHAARTILSAATVS